MRTDASWLCPTPASFGIATATGEDFSTLVERADSALYAAKAAGRNRVERDGCAPRLAA